MTYIELINSFWLRFDTLGISTNEGFLYLFILNKYNEGYWKDEYILIFPDEVCKKLGISRATFIALRKSLEDKGLICLSKTSKNQPPKIKLADSAVQNLDTTVQNLDTKKESTVQNLDTHCLKFRHRNKDIKIKENSPYRTTKESGVSFDVVSLKDRKKNFGESLSPYIPKYGQDMVDEFFLYWTKEVEPDKMRFEKQNTFSISGRLATWFKNQMTTRQQVLDIETKTAMFGIDWDKVVTWYRGLGLPLTKLTDKRKMAYIMMFSSFDGDKVRIRDALKKFTDEVKKSDWLLGKSNKSAKDFEWFFTIDNFLKIIEGRYRNDKKPEKNENDSTRQADRRKTFISEAQNDKPHNADF